MNAVDWILAAYLAIGMHCSLRIPAFGEGPGFYLYELCLSLARTAIWPVIIVAVVKDRRKERLRNASAQATRARQSESDQNASESL